MNACTPWMKSRWSYNKAAVASDGAPSLNSNVPSRVSTLSGVEIDLTVSAETSAIAVLLPHCGFDHCESDVVTPVVTQIT